MHYHFELYQELRIVVFERCTPSDNLKQQTLVGAADCTLGKIVSARGAELKIGLVNMQRGSKVGTVYLSAEQVMSAKKFVTLEISMSRLMNEEQQALQHTYLQHLRDKASAPVEKPTLQKRGMAAFGNVFTQRFRKDGKGPAVLPAHLENEVAKEEQSREKIWDEVAQIENAPPPFVPFLSILRAPKEASTAMNYNDPNIQWIEVYKSVNIKDYTDLVEGVRLEKFTLSEYDLTEGDKDRLLKIAVVQNRSNQQSQIVGEHVTTFPALKRACEHAQDPTLKLQPAGILTIHEYKEVVQPSFIDYIKGGMCDFGLVCAIDFTSSNGNPRQPGTRHFNTAYLNAPAPPNEYEAAMRAVGNMLASYSSDSRILAYGFGANLPPQYNVSHCFPVTEHELGDPFCNGVDALVIAYKATLNRIQLYGPTIFSEVLRTVGVVVSRRTEAAIQAGNNSLAYTVLLILTDGVISDYDATVAELIKLSSLPLSVVIIGIGNEDFGKMHALDGSNGLLKRGTEQALREFVQFVPYQDFKGDMSVLAERVLGGIPDQVMSYTTKIRGQRDPSQGAN